MNNMEKINLDEATDADVRDFARIFLQIEGADADAIKKVRADVVKAWPQNFIWKALPVQALQVVGGTDTKPSLTKEEIEKKAGAGIAASSSKNDPVVVLTLHRHSGPGGRDPVYLNVNGSALHIARGITQKVPYRYFHDLQNAVQNMVDQDEKTLEITNTRTERFPATIHSMPTDDEIFAFELLDANRAGQTITRDEFDARRRKEAAELTRIADRDELERLNSAKSA